MKIIRKVTVDLDIKDDGGSLTIETTDDGPKVKVFARLSYEHLGYLMTGGHFKVGSTAFSFGTAMGGDRGTELSIEAEDIPSGISAFRIYLSREQVGQLLSIGAVTLRSDAVTAHPERIGKFNHVAIFKTPERGGGGLGLATHSYAQQIEDTFGVTAVVSKISKQNNGATKRVTAWFDRLPEPLNEIAWFRVALDGSYSETGEIK